MAQGPKFKIPLARGLVPLNVCAKYHRCRPSARGLGALSPFIATQLNSTRRRVELSWVAIDTLTDATQLSPTIADATDPVEAYSQSARSRPVELSCVAINGPLGFWHCWHRTDGRTDIWPVLQVISGEMSKTSYHERYLVGLMSKSGKFCWSLFYSNARYFAGRRQPIISTRSAVAEKLPDTPYYSLMYGGHQKIDDTFSYYTASPRLLFIAVCLFVSLCRSLIVS